MRALLLVSALLALPVATASAATERRCGDLPGTVQPPSDIRALGVSCKTAKALARRHFNNSGRYDFCSLAKASCRLDGWTCRRTFFGNSGTRVKCTKGEKRVRFIYGS